MENFLIGKKHIHFIGIGGSGMFPLAQILHGQGYYLTGSDNNETETLKAVRNMGMPAIPRTTFMRAYAKFKASGEE